MATTVEITLADDGTISVGLADEPASDSDQMQQAPSIDAALKMAAHLLQNPPADASQAPTAPDASGGASAPAGAGGQQSAQDMWNAQLAQTPPH